MTENQPGRPAADKPERRFDSAVRNHFTRKREKMRAEIARNRQGGHRVPTWVLAVILVAIVGAWLLLIFTA